MSVVVGEAVRCAAWNAVNAVCTFGCAWVDRSGQRWEDEAMMRRKAKQ